MQALTYNIYNQCVNVYNTSKSTPTLDASDIRIPAGSAAHADKTSLGGSPHPETNYAHPPPLY